MHEVVIMKSYAKMPHLNREAEEQTSQQERLVSGERRAADIIGGILQSGVILSALIIMSGFALLLLSPGGISQQALLIFPHTPSEIWRGFVRFQPQAVIMLGLLLLIATPVLRVAASVIIFAIEQDRRYVAITLIV